MNDLGLEEPIAEADSELRGTYQTRSHHNQSVSSKTATAPAREPNKRLPSYQSPAYSQGPAETEIVAHQLPTRWWYASTGFPLIAGTFGPMANAFSICALVENWRVEIPPGGTEEHGIDIPDPRWLTSINAVSLVFALIANLSLLLNMAKRVPFRWAQPVTISGFWVSSVLLVVLVGYGAHDFHAPGVENQALTQAYYYGCWAAGLYQLISIMMCITVYGAVTHRYSSDFNLTMAQRTLMLQTIAFLIYLLLGAFVFSRIENWKFLDAVYWSDFTLLTIGIGGELVPVTHLGRGLLFPFSIGGIVTLGLVVSSIRSMVLDRGKRKLHARMTEKMRRRVVKQVNDSSSQGKIKRRNTTGLDRSLMRRLTLEPAEDYERELERRRAEFEAMRQVEELTSHRQKWLNLVVSTTAFAILWFIGAVVFWQIEGPNQGWTYFDALYFSWTSLLTIGYGDLIPLSNAGRPFFVFWSLLAIPTLTILISDMGDTVVRSIKDVTIWIGEVTILPSDQGSMTDRLRYGLSKTLRMQKLKPGQVNDGDQASDGSSTKEESTFIQPGLVKLFRSSSKTEAVEDNSGENIANEAMDEATSELEEAEEQGEQEAHDRGDRFAEDEHHYRHMLISEIRKLYADKTHAVPKKYSYDEWAYYLRLLGEDEGRSTFHNHAPVEPQCARDYTNIGKADSEEPQKSPNSTPEQDTIVRWSWIGPRSPLMTRGDKSEAEWLISRLFERLEESLRNIRTDKEEFIHQKPIDSPSAGEIPGQPYKSHQAASYDRNDLSRKRET